MIDLRACSLLALSPLLVSATPPAVPLDQPAYEAPAQAWRSVEDAEQARRCRDRIEQVRSEAGKPRLEREPARPDKPLLMYAVDHRVDGCGVLVPVGDRADIRQAPEPGRPEVIPAR